MMDEHGMAGVATCGSKLAETAPAGAASAGTTPAEATANEMGFAAASSTEMGLETIETGLGTIRDATARSVASSALRGTAGRRTLAVRGVAAVRRTVFLHGEQSVRAMRNVVYELVGALRPLPLVGLAVLLMAGTGCAAREPEPRDATSGTAFSVSTALDSAPSAPLSATVSASSSSLRASSASPAGTPSSSLSPTAGSRAPAVDRAAGQAAGQVQTASAVAQNNDPTSVAAAQKRSPATPASSAKPATATVAPAGDPGAPVHYRAAVYSDDGVRFEVPTEVEQGGVLLARVLLARVLLDTPGPAQVTAVWEGKSYVAPVRANQAAFLLPVPLDTPSGEDLPLDLRVGPRRLHASVRMAGVNWPRQNIAVDGKYVSPPPEVTAQIKRDQARVKAVLGQIRPGQDWELPFVRPVPGTVSSVFGGKRVFNGQPRSFHRGVDLRGAEGTPIRALAAGKVVIAEPQYFSGNVVFVDHGQGFVTLYAHLSAFSVKEGDTVRAGDELGRVGATGRVTGPHLHLGALIHGKPVNPLALVNLAPAAR